MIRFAWGAMSGAGGRKVKRKVKESRHWRILLVFLHCLYGFQLYLAIFSSRAEQKSSVLLHHVQYCTVALVYDRQFSATFAGGLICFSGSSPRRGGGSLLLIQYCDAGATRDYSPRGDELIFPVMTIASWQYDGRALERCACHCLPISHWVLSAWQLPFNVEVDIRFRRPFPARPITISKPVKRPVNWNSSDGADLKKLFAQSTFCRTKSIHWSPTLYTM